MSGQPEMLFDLIVIGGGSGGIASANRAASYGARVALIEFKKLGGTCVNLGCVPKKIMWCAASLADAFHDAPSYGFTGIAKPSLDWKLLKSKRDAFISRLNGIYQGNLQKNGVEVFNGWGKLLGSNRVAVTPANGSNPSILEGKNILIATGSEGILPASIPGHDLGGTSDSFFALEAQPKLVAIVGAGYVGVELAGVLNALGSHVTMFTRKCGVLTHFDPMIQAAATEHLASSGVEMLCETSIEKIEKNDGGLSIEFTHRGQLKILSGFDSLIWAIGRAPLVSNLGLDACGVTLDARGAIPVDEYQNVIGTSENLLAVGDVTGVHMLTPVAIAAGRKLAGII